MIVRHAGVNDFATCVTLALSFLETVCVPRSNLVANDVAEHMNNPATFFFVAEVENKIVGIFYGSLDHNVFDGERYARERMIYIQPTFRSPTIFSQFLDAYDKWATEKGCVFSQFKARGSENNEALTRLMTGKYGYTNVGYVLEKRYE